MKRGNAHEAGARAGCVGIIGNLNMDLLLGPLAHVPAFGREAFVAEQALRPAGQAFHTAMALAALGDDPRLISAVGDDLFGGAIITALRDVGVGLAGVHPCRGRQTGLSVALLDERRDRAFVTYLGHLEALKATTVMNRWERIAGCHCLLLCGYFCLPGLRPAAANVLARARSEGMITALDTGWDPDDWRGATRAELRALLRHVDIFLPNRDEACALAGVPDPAAAAAHIASWGPSTVIVKLGADGALGWRDGDQTHVPGMTTTVVDTVGAGDAFNAGALYALVRAWPLAAVLEAGVAVASQAIAHREPRYTAIESLRQQLARLAKRPKDEALDQSKGA